MAVRPGYKQTEAGLIPEDWDAEALGAHVVITSGSSPSLFRFETTGTPYFKVDQLNNEPKYLSTTPYFFRGEQAVHRGSLIFPKRGASILLNKVRILMHDAFMDTNLMTLTPKDAIDSEYLYYALTYVQLWRIADTTSIPQINNKHIIPLVLPCPPVGEQRTIATALSDVDALLAKLDALIAKKRDLKVAAMQQLLTGQTRLPGFRGEWEVKRLGDVVTMGSGGTPTSSVSAYYDGDYPWVSISDMTKGGKVITKTDKNLSADGLANSAAQMFPAGTILYAMYASLGECSIAGMPLCTSQAILGIRPQDRLNPDFLYYYLTSLKNAVKSMGQQGTQANLNKGMVQAFQLGLPPVKEQTAIATILSDMDTELTALEARRDKTRALKQGMMQELLTGRIRLV